MSPWDLVFPGMKTSFGKTHHEDCSNNNALCKLDLGMWTCSQKRFRDTSNVQLGLQFAEVERERLGEKEAQNDWLEALLIRLDYVEKLKDVERLGEKFHSLQQQRQVKVVSATL